MQSRLCWRERAEFVGRYLTKGRQVVVEGRITTRKYTGNDNKTHKVVEITASNIYFADSNGGAGNGNSYAGDGFMEAPADGDLPFN